MALAESALKASPEEAPALVAMADISLRQGNGGAESDRARGRLQPAQKGKLKRNES